MNNKLRQGLIISTIVTLGLLGQVKEAIAQTLNDKNIDKTEELARVTDNTASAISANFDLDRSSPDVSAVKQFFMEWDILTNDEKKDFIKLRDKISKNDARIFYERQMQRALNWTYTNEEAKMFIGALMDQAQETARWKTEHEKVNQKKIYQYIFSQMLRQITSEINLAQSEARLKQSIKEGEQLKAEGEQLKAEGEQLKAEGEQLKAEIIELKAEGEKLKAEGEKLKAEGEKLKQDEEELRGLKRTLMDVEEVFKNYLKIEGEKLEQDKEKLDEKIESLNKVEKTFENQKKE